MDKFKWKEVLPRIFADSAIVHLSMIGALAVSVVIQTALGNGVRARNLITDFAHYYTTFFWLLSPIFPLVFLANGFYTRGRGYVGKRKTWVILRGVVLGVMTFSCVNVLLFGHTAVSRSVVFPFLALAGIGLASVRLLKA